MAEPTFVTVTWRGLRLAEKARLLEDGSGVFVEHDAPLPVGARVHVESPGAAPREARVVAVVEQEGGGRAGAAAGMRLEWEAPEARESETPAALSSRPISAEPESPSADAIADGPPERDDGRKSRKKKRR